jgi:hypothetical protein
MRFTELNTYINHLMNEIEIIEAISDDMKVPVSKMCELIAMEAFKLGSTGEVESITSDEYQRTLHEPEDACSRHKF